MPYAYLPWSSGGQKLVTLFFNYLGKEVELSVIGVEGNDVSSVQLYQFIPLLKKSRSRYYDISLVKKISNYVIENKIETIIWEHPYYAWLAFRIRKRTGVRTIFHTHNIEHQRFRSLGKWWWPILKWYEKWCFKKADHLFFITPEDRTFATTNWKIDTAKTSVVPFGIEINSYPADRVQCRDKVNQLYNIRKDDTLLFFNGALDYKPNQEALSAIINHINPLLGKSGIAYKILVAGRGLPAEFNNLQGQLNVIYTGFVDDIEMHFKATDIFLNPVQSGGGIKTKMVEAIGYGATVVSTETGAIGIDKAACGEKLVVVKDNDWERFADEVVRNGKKITMTPAQYYTSYFYGNIIKRISEILKLQ